MSSIEPYDTSWPERFAQTRGELGDLLGRAALTIEHIGSTAIPGLAAKPTIDIAVKLERADDVDAFEIGLARAGFRRNLGGPRTHPVFVRHDDGQRTHIVHFFGQADWDTCNQRLLRDHLLANQNARQQYQELKLALDQQGTRGRAYTQAKTPLLQDLTNAERALRGLRDVDIWEK